MTRKDTGDYVHLKKKITSSSGPSKCEHIHNNQSKFRESEIQTIYPIHHPKISKCQPSKQEDFNLLIKKHQKSLEILTK